VLFWVQSVHTCSLDKACHAHAEIVILDRILTGKEKPEYLGEEDDGTAFGIMGVRFRRIPAIAAWTAAGHMDNVERDSARVEDDAVEDGQLAGGISDTLVDQLKCSMVVLPERWIVGSEFLHVLVQSADDAVGRTVERQMLQPR